MKDVLGIFGRQAVEELEKKFRAQLDFVRDYRRQLKCWRFVYDHCDNEVLREFAMHKLQVIGRLYTRWRLDAMNTLHLLKELREAEKDAACEVA